MDLFKNKSYRDGYQTGYRDGRQDGFAEGRVSAITDRHVPERPADVSPEPQAVPAGHQLVGDADVELLSLGAHSGQIVKPLANSMGEPIGFIPYQEQ